ncbi:MAG: M23 family metallopeptidase [Myxococcales bacterium]|jgi:murein DD-endopeptidase MepM/ murein hydrolase activator NlpD|nr:M23 family metallopeptidase [Myxococcales bacterium]
MKIKIKTEYVVAAGALIFIGFLVYKRKKNQVNEDSNIAGAISEKTVSTGAARRPGILIWPSESRNVKSRFGPRAAPTAGASTEHNGIDIAMPQGSEIVATAAGTIDRIWLDTTYGGGLSMRLKHSGGLTTGYAHLSSTLWMKEGDEVGQGYLIAESGGTPGSYGAGTSTGPHLHFTVREDGVAVDPMIFLPEVAIS